MRVRCVAIVASAFLIAANNLFAGTNGQNVWTPELSMKYKTVRATAISPDGKLIAYVVREPVMEGEKSEYLSHIWIVSSDGEMNVQYTRGDQSATNPAFSPDGQHLTFLSKRDEKTQLWIMRVRGGEAEQLTEAENGVASYRWSPDGSRIAYTMKEPDNEEEKKAKKEKRDVILVDQNFKNNHLYTISIAKNADRERATQRLTSGDFHVTGFDWSPDSETVVFAHQPDPRINTGFSQRDISTVPSDSGDVKPLVSRPGVDSNPAFSPDGKWVAFISNGGQPEEVGLREAHIVSADGGRPRKLADSPDRNTRGGITWSIDGKLLYINEAVGTSRHVVGVPVDGSPARLLTKGDGAFGTVSYSRNGKHMAFSFQNLDTPIDVYTASPKDFKMKQLTDIHQDVPKPPMAKTELISWKSKDGLEIEGLLTYPVDYQKGRKYPLILNVHGGPAGVYSQMFTGNPSIYMIQY
ncbi:hypothetical protein MJD09_16525, partial [bacterium]|nr:hypothetical protein [bacterium]